MNELVTREMVENGVTTDLVLDRIEQMKMLEEWFSTLKWQFKKVCEQTGLKKWETDYFQMNYIPDGEATRTDTNRMKNESIYVVNGESGELEEVNAYEYFKMKSPVKAHVTYKEKK